jgi:hypothetical protein
MYMYPYRLETTAKDTYILRLIKSTIMTLHMNNNFKITFCLIDFNEPKYSIYFYLSVGVLHRMAGAGEE